jgi:hypothetical protein
MINTKKYVYFQMLFVIFTYVLQKIVGAVLGYGKVLVAISSLFERHFSVSPLLPQYESLLGRNA